MADGKQWYNSSGNEPAKRKVSGNPSMHGKPGAGRPQNGRPQGARPQSGKPQAGRAQGKQVQGQGAVEQQLKRYDSSENVRATARQVATDTNKEMK